MRDVLESVRRCCGGEKAHKKTLPMMAGKFQLVHMEQICSCLGVPYLMA